MANIRKVRQNKDGSTTYQITAYDGTGKRRTTSCKIKAGTKDSAAKRELQRAAVLFEEQVKNSYGINDKRLTFGQYASDYVAKGSFAYKTRRSYQSLLGRILPALGKIPLSKLSPQHIEGFVEALQQSGTNERPASATAKQELINAYKEKGLTIAAASRLCHVGTTTVSNALKGRPISPQSAELIAEGLGLKPAKAFSFTGGTQLSEKTVKEYHRFIVAVLNKAKKQRLIVHNVASEYMDAPKVHRKEAEYLEPEELAQVLAAADEEPIRIKAIIYTLAFTGLRRSELCGLDWQDINMTKSSVSVHKTRQSVTGEGVVIMPTKTESSVRTVTIPTLLLEVLQAYRSWWLAERLRLGSAWVDTDAVFVGWNGKPLHPDTISKTVTEFAERQGLFHLSPHMFRHTFATLQLANGVDIKTLAARTGHSQTSTLLNVYSHLLQQQESAAASVFDDLFNKKSGM